MHGSIRGVVGMFLALLSVAAPGSARGQEGQPVPKPTAEHALLAKDVGTWDATIKSWDKGPDSEPNVSEGVEVAKLMPGGLWLQTEFDGKFGTQEFHGSGLTGFDTRKAKFVGTWVDSMTTEIMIMEGDYDSATRTLTTFSKGTSPSGKPYDAKMVGKHEDDNTRVFTMSIKSEETKGEYIKMMEITYKRRAK
jgi:hypothetical protein